MTFDPGWLKDIILLVVGALLGGLFGVGMTVRYEDRWKAASDRRKRLKRARAIERLRAGNGTFSIGGQNTSVYPVEGDGISVMEPTQIKVRLRSTAQTLPPDIEAARERIVRQLRRAKPPKAGNVAPWNSTVMVALHAYRISRSPSNEDIVLHLDVAPNDYATFAATVLTLGHNSTEVDANGAPIQTSLRQKYLPNDTAILRAVRRPIPFLANGVGVVLLVFTDDGKVVLTRRGENSRARPGQGDVSVVEGMDGTQDVDAGVKVDVYCTAVRGCMEELGIEVRKEDVRLIAFVVDMDFYQWNFLGFVEARRSADQVLSDYTAHAKDRWEGKISFVAANPTTVFQALLRDGVWDTGLVAAYLAFCYRLGIGPTQDAAEAVFGVRQREPPWRRGR